MRISDKVAKHDQDIFKLHTPSITIIEKPIEEIAKTSIGILSNSIEGNVLKEDYWFCKNAKLVIRHSA